MNWYRNYKCRHMSNVITITKNNLYFNKDVVNNNQLSQFNYAQVAFIDKKLYIQFTKDVIENANNYKLQFTKHSAITIGCVAFINLFLTKGATKYTNTKVLERDAEHVIFQAEVDHE